VQHRSQPGSRNGSTNSSHGNIITDEEEESIASRNKRRKRNKTRRQLLADQQQDDYVHRQRTFTLQAQQITNDRKLPTYQS
jgi:hypothetical protein